MFTTLTLFSNHQLTRGPFDLQMIISVLGGLPGSHKESLATCLMKLSRDESRWAIMHHSLEERQEFSAEKLHAKLSAVWQVRNKHRHGTRPKKPRALLITPGYVHFLFPKLIIFPHLSFSRVFTISLWRAGHYLCHPVFLVLSSVSWYFFLLLFPRKVLMCFMCAFFLMSSFLMWHKVERHRKLNKVERHRKLHKVERHPKLQSWKTSKTEQSWKTSKTAQS